MVDQWDCCLVRKTGDCLYKNRVGRNWKPNLLQEIPGLARECLGSFLGMPVYLVNYIPGNQTKLDLLFKRIDERDRN